MGLKATPIVEVDAYTPQVFSPAPGTPVLAADVEAGEQALANRTEHIKNGNTQFDGDKTFTGTVDFQDQVTAVDITVTDDLILTVNPPLFDPPMIVTYARPVTAVGATVGPTGSEWVYTVGQPILVQSVLSINQISLLLHLPGGARLSAVRVRIQPAPGHLNLPSIGGVMPQIQLQRLDVATGAVVDIGPLFVDPSPDPASYELIHDLGGSFAPIILSVDDSLYSVRLRGESGPNAIAGLRVFSVTTVTEHDIMNVGT